MPIDKLQGTCSVCLRAMQLHGASPIRHGFAAIGVRHGQNSGYHTGPCQGTRFPHLGISIEGTLWAIDNARDRLGRVEEELLRLAGNPDLTWYRRTARGLSDTTSPVVLRFGEDVAYAGDGRPTYAWERKRRITEQTSLKTELERAIDTYAKVIATWAPEKYPVTGAAVKLETCHMEMPRHHSMHGDWTGILCRFTKPGSASELPSKTGDPAQVTCKRCRTTLGLPAL